MKRIQFILNNRFLYGANRSVLTIIEYFILKGHEVKVLVPFWGSMADELKRKGIPYEVIPFYSAFLYIRPILKHILVPFLLMLDVLIFPFILFRTWQFNPDIIYSNTSAENSGIFLSKILRKKHIWHIREFMRNDYKFYFLFGKKIKSRLIRMSDKSIYVSQSVIEEVHEKHVDEKFKVIYNGIDLNIDVLPEIKMSNDSIVFGMVGILDPAKGYELAIQYFCNILEKHPNSNLFIFGDKEGSYKNKILTKLDKLGIMDKVIFKGFVKDQDEIYSSINILLVFSKSEGFGRVTIESALYGIPVIGYNNAGTSELINHKVTGCLFNSYDSFEDSIDFLLIGDNYQKVRAAAFHQAKTKFNVLTYCKEIYNFLEVKE
tara:strand:+ start:148 stop:1272 length:1125 start_codon:yes stop_codon:yes gene_type:complete